MATKDLYCCLYPCRGAHDASLLVGLKLEINTQEKGNIREGERRKSNGGGAGKKHFARECQAGVLRTDFVLNVEG